jgi:peptidase M1-like protein
MDLVFICKMDLATAHRFHHLEPQIPDAGAYIPWHRGLMSKVRPGDAAIRGRVIPLIVIFTNLAGCTLPAPRPDVPTNVTATVSTTLAKGTYNPLESFAPLTLPDPVTLYRSADGTPGPAFWQNRADYVIHASLDTTTHVLTADEIIGYTNNSPSTLDYLWIQLDQNIYRSDSRGRVVNARYMNGGVTGGYSLDLVEIERDGKRASAATTVSDTRLLIRLDRVLPSHGGKLNIRIHYHYTVPGETGGRTAHAPSRNGEIYDIAQWYPRMAVFDDLRGWDTLPYLGSEFYLEYGDIDYYVTVPSDMLVAGSGELQNPQEVLTPLERTRLAQAASSDTTIMIRSADEIGDAASTTATAAAAARTLTWHYRMRDTRDVAFAASRAFIWDAARINLPEGKSALAMSFYPIESSVHDGWGRDTEYLKDAVQNFSRRWGTYPYPVAVAVAGPVNGMEYPAMVFDGISDAGSFLFWLTAHEIGHTWFPMMVGTNERRDQWMDEGFNTFIDIYESEDFEHGAFGPKRDSEYAPGGGNPVDEIVPLLADPAAPVLLTRADQVTEKYRHPVTYFKSALGLVLLREQILGPERFDWAFRKFIRDWAFHHPSPSDFFRAMDSAGGEDLSWFWRGWYFNNWTFDLAVEKVAPITGDWSHGATIEIVNRDRLVLPAVVEIAFEDGSSQRISLAAESWIHSNSASIRLDSHQPLQAVTVDPDHLLPDRDRANNVWKPAQSP